jgi:predicted phage-related endonuclease
VEWLDGNRIKINPPKRPKRITGTRFASILGLDRWNTPFKTWCAITRTYEEPFVDNVYTIAGKTIEPKIIDYLRKVYWMEIKTPEDIYGKDYFEKTWGNFFPYVDIFGGMWDGLYYEHDSLDAIIEIKTTKRVEDWVNGAPDHYALQGAEYAYLKGLDRVIMVCAFLEEKDYENPENFIPSSDNVYVDDFYISERYPQFQAYIDRATDWWNEHVVTGISPQFDEKKDADILKELRKNTIETDDDISVLIAEGEALKSEISQVTESIADKEKRLKEITTALKKYCMGQFREGDEKVAIAGQVYEWVLSKSVSTDIDKSALKKAGLLDKYSKEKVSYRFTQSPIKKGESM